MTEYQSLIVDRAVAGGATKALVDAMVQLPGWHDCLLDLTHSVGPDTGELLQEACPRSLLRFPSPQSTYHVETAGSLANYMAGLTASARRRLFHKRRRLIADYGEVRFERADEQAIPEFLSELNKLHTIRWARPALSPNAQSFVSDLAKSIGGRGFRECLRNHHGAESNQSGFGGTTGGLELSRLVVAGATRSVLLSFRSEGTECNIQQGFDESFDRRLPLGYIHFGYALERAFADPAVQSYDFLVGRGKNTDYKRALATGSVALRSVHVVRAPLLKAAFRLRDRWRGGAD